MRNIHVIKIHKKSPKLTLFRFDDFKSSDLPRLAVRVKIDLQTQQVRFFDHSTDTNPEVLFGKVFLEGGTNGGLSRRVLTRLISQNLPFGPIVRTSVLEREAEAVNRET
jgi:hypothetical protein